MFFVLHILINEIGPLFVGVRSTKNMNDHEEHYVSNPDTGKVINP
jgi:hypothetical protein